MGAVVTGGCGFIGSHLVDALAGRGECVAVIDNLSTGSEANIAGPLRDGSAIFRKADLLQEGWEDLFTGADRVYHLAADPDVRMSGIHPENVVRNNILATARVLEAMRRHDVPGIVFTSTSTVYGDASVIPTPEDYAPLEPISVYAASKLACEALISAYCHSYGMKGWVFRFANIIGERSNHGVIWDFVHKLKENPRVLEILGDGKQTKSYLEVHECVTGHALYRRTGEGNLQCPEHRVRGLDRCDRDRRYRCCSALDLPKVDYRFTGGERGWVGDVPRMLLSIDRLRALGWKPVMGSRESVDSRRRGNGEGSAVKVLVVLGDGMADEPIAELGGKTPLEYARTPNFDRIAREGACGMVRTIPPGFEAGSDIANLSHPGIRSPGILHRARAHRGREHGGSPGRAGYRLPVQPGHRDRRGNGGLLGRPYPEQRGGAADPRRGCRR